MLLGPQRVRDNRGLSLHTSCWESLQMGKALRLLREEESLRMNKEGKNRTWKKE